MIPGTAPGHSVPPSQPTTVVLAVVADRTEREDDCMRQIDRQDLFYLPKSIDRIQATQASD
jgi:hypothetical protein